jgi:hypothetical protein
VTPGAALLPAGRRRLGAPQRLASVVSRALGAGAVLALLAGAPALALKLALVLAPIAVARRVGADERLVAALAAAIAVETVSTLVGLYDAVAWWDVLAHTVLPALMTGVALATIERVTGPLTPRRAALAAFAGVVALGVAWEAVERLADVLLGSDFSLGRADTLLDLVCDVAGAAGGALVIRRARRPAFES